MSSKQSSKHQLAYAVWRWDMWMAGYGSYTEIERKLKDRELVALVRPENQAKALAARNSWIGRLRTAILGGED